METNSENSRQHLAIHVSITLVCITLALNRQPLSRNSIELRITIQQTF